MLALEELSTLWCGNHTRLPVMVWIRSQPSGTSFYQTELAEGVGVEHQYMGRELKVLCELEMLRALPPERGDRRKFYIANEDHPLWAIVDAFAAVAPDHHTDLR